jgi:hypothetical protein
MSTTAIHTLQRELAEAQTALKNQQANDAEAITLGERAKMRVDGRKRVVAELEEAIRVLEKRESVKQHPAGRDDA